ncbi:MAG: hypothetical protein PHE17_15895 [Thiothrix sp.]|uniref:hypothetical protein n=1 Tax=Thiothrix sp. TaxID=1032 RepID=UPI00261280BD|nr:hypothetical protein [Thiothrix sp.]MDD5394498.1 hypothetical protein [Thiothrix sp.]
MTNQDWYPILKKLSAGKVFITSLLIIGVIPSIISILEGNAFKSTEFPQFSFFGDFIVWPISFIVIFPILNSLCYIFYTASTSAINDAISNGVIKFTKKDDLINKDILLSKSKMKLIIVLIASLIMTSAYWLGPTQMLQEKTWCYGHYFGFSLLFYTSVLIWLFESFLILNLLFDFILWTRLAKTIVSDKERIIFSPILFHPDKSAGLSIFGSVATKIYLIVFVLIIFVLIQFLEKFIAQPNITTLEVFLKYKAVPISFLFLISILPLSLILPLSPFYNEIRVQKQKYLQHLHKKTKDKLMIYQENILDASSNDLTINKDDVENIYSAYQHIQSIKEWPFDSKAIITILSSIILPLASPFLEKIF